MPSIIVLGAFDIEIRNPTELSIDVSILGLLGIVRESSTFNLISFIRIVLSLGLDEDGLLLLEILIKILSIVSMIPLVEERWRVVMSLVPHFIGGC
jgi:hypothetical protein